MILVGSGALSRYIVSRDVNDLDYIGTFAESQQFFQDKSAFEFIMPQKGKMIGKYHASVPTSSKSRMVEIEIAWPGSSGEKFIELVKDDPRSTYHPDGTIVPSLSALLALKLSHRYLKNSPHFLKTMKDIANLRNLIAWRGEKLSMERYKDWIKLREKETYTYSHPNLNQSKKDFFTDDVGYEYDHDSIHKIVAKTVGVNEPTYTLFKKDGSEVAVDKSKWEALPEDRKISAVVEESLVLALERSQVPHPNVLTPRRSFEKALEKVCTSITSGWFREYAWEHYSEAVKLFNRVAADTYVSDFWRAVSQGEVPKHKEN